jgi:hypothetical protein
MTTVPCVDLVSANESVMSIMVKILRLIIKKINGNIFFVDDEEFFTGVIIVIEA